MLVSVLQELLQECTWQYASRGQLTELPLLTLKETCLDIWIVNGSIESPSLQWVVSSLRCGDLMIADGEQVQILHPISSYPPVFSNVFHTSMGPGSKLYM